MKGNDQVPEALEAPLSVNQLEDRDIEFFARQMRVSPTAVRSAVERVGADRVAVESELKRCR